MIQSDGRKACVLFLTCWGGRPKYFLQLSNDFRRQYRIIPYIYNVGALLPRMYAALEKELEHCDLLIYQAYDSVPILKATREHAAQYDHFAQCIPSHVTKIAVPVPYFPPFWPFHCSDPRNANPNRSPNRYGKLPVFGYGDSYVLRLLKQGIPPEEVISRYIALDLSKQVDLDKVLDRTRSVLERQDSTGPVKFADFICSNFRSTSLLISVNHMNMRMSLYITNQVLKLLDCATVPETVLDSLAELVERPNPVHPSIARHFGVDYIDENTRYPIDDIRKLTFAEFIRDYVHYTDGILDYRDGLISHRRLPAVTPGRRPTEDVDATEGVDELVTETSPELVA